MSKYLGALEELILLLVLRENETYGAEILKIYISEFSKEITLPAVVMVLKRLEAKGLLKSHMGEPTAQRGGRSKKLYQATELGYKMANEAMTSKNQIWEMVPKVS